MRQKPFFFLLLLFCLPLLMEGKTADTLIHRNSLQLDLCGQAIGGIGLGYEHILKQERNQNEVTSLGASVGFSFWRETYVTPGLGINANWYLFRQNRISLITGLYGYALIALNPTPKTIRDLYSTNSFYGGRYVNPVEPVLAGVFGVQIPLHSFFMKVAFTPMFSYDRVFTHRFSCTPWAGFSFGYYFQEVN